MDTKKATLSIVRARSHVCVSGEIQSHVYHVCKTVTFACHCTTYTSSCQLSCVGCAEWLKAHTQIDGHSSHSHMPTGTHTHTRARTAALRNVNESPCVCMCAQHMDSADFRVSHIPLTSTSLLAVYRIVETWLLSFFLTLFVRAESENSGIMQNNLKRLVTIGAKVIMPGESAGAACTNAHGELGAYRARRTVCVSNRISFNIMQ